MSKSNVNTLKRGLKHLGLSLFITAFLALAVVCFIGTAKLTGYAAVVVFLGGLASALTAYIGLFAQGLACDIWTESRGERE